MKLLPAIALATVLTSLSGMASAQFAKPEDAIKYRKAALTVMGTHFGRVAAMATGRAPYDAAAAAANMQVAELASKLPWTAFVPGTDKGETNAKPEIWSDAAKFKEASEKMQMEMAKLSAAAKTGNADALKAAFGTTAPTCKACHDSFRKN
jgi:cytochrome c556